MLVEALAGELDSRQTYRSANFGERPRKLRFIRRISQRVELWAARHPPAGSDAGRGRAYATVPDPRDALLVLRTTPLAA